MVFVLDIRCGAGARVTKYGWLKLGKIISSNNPPAENCAAIQMHGKMFLFHLFPARPKASCYH